MSKRTAIFLDCLMWLAAFMAIGGMCSAFWVMAR